MLTKSVNCKVGHPPMICLGTVNQQHMSLATNIWGLLYYFNQNFLQMFTYTILEADTNNYQN